MAGESLHLHRLDARGNAHALWDDGDDKSWSVWPVVGAWTASAKMPEYYTLVVGPSSSFMWSERNELLVRRFDPDFARWSDAVSLRDLTKTPKLRMLTLATGRDGAALRARRLGWTLLVRNLTRFESPVAQLSRSVLLAKDDSSH